MSPSSLPQTLVRGTILCLAALVSSAGDSLGVSRGELPRHGSARLHQDPAEAYMRPVLVRRRSFQGERESPHAGAFRSKKASVSTNRAMTICWTLPLCLAPTGSFATWICADKWIFVIRRFCDLTRHHISTDSETEEVCIRITRTICLRRPCTDHGDPVKLFLPYAVGWLGWPTRHALKRSERVPRPIKVEPGGRYKNICQPKMAGL